MKKLYFLLLTMTAIYFSSCSNSPADKAESAVKSYLKENLKNSNGYDPISFSKLDTLKNADTSDVKKISLYVISHSYTITNSDKEKVKMTVRFYLDKDLKVNHANTKSINGNYGSLTGNAYWKYNNYVGNKPDAGATVTLYSLDTIRGNLKYETSADVQGNYKLEKVLPGKYFLIVRSQNATDCPERHIQNLQWYSHEIKQLLGFDINQYKAQLDEIKSLDSTYTAILIDNDYSKYGGLLNKMDKYTSIEKEMRDKANNLIDMFSKEFIEKIKLYTGYSNAYDFTTIWIEEDNTGNNNTDFGITCI